MKKTYVPSSKKSQPVISYFTNETADAWEATSDLDKAYPFKNRRDAEELGKRWVADQASERHFSVEVLEIEHAAAA